MSTFCTVVVSQHHQIESSTQVSQGESRAAVADVATDVRIEAPMTIHVSHSAKRWKGESGSMPETNIPLELVAKVSDTSGVLDVSLKDGTHVVARASIEYSADHRRGR